MDHYYQKWSTEVYCAGTRIDLIWQLQSMRPAVLESHSLLQHFQLHWPTEAATLLDPLATLSTFLPSGEILDLRLQELQQTVDALRSSDTALRLWGTEPPRNNWSRAKALLPGLDLVDGRRLWCFCELLVEKKAHLARSLAIYLVTLTEGRDFTNVPRLQELLTAPKNATDA